MHNVINNVIRQYAFELREKEIDLEMARLANQFRLPGISVYGARIDILRPS